MNKLKKTNTLLVLALLILSSVVMVTAISEPHPIYGIVSYDGSAVRNAQVRVKDLATGESQITSSDNSGRYQADLGNFVNGFRTGDIIEISIVHCEDSSACKSSVKVSGGGNSANFDISGQTLPSTTSVVTSTPVIDSSSTTSSDKAECEKCVPSSNNCPVCPASTLCPIKENNSLVAIISSVLAGLGGLGLGGYFIKRKEALGKNGGIKIYTGNDGKEKVLHKHQGIVGYHDPNITHRDVNDRHPKGELTPKYEKNEKGVWVYVE